MFKRKALIEVKVQKSKFQTLCNLKTNLKFKDSSKNKMVEKELKQLTNMFKKQKSKCKEQLKSSKNFIKN